MEWMDWGGVARARLAAAGLWRAGARPPADWHRRCMAHVETAVGPRFEVMRSVETPRPGTFWRPAVPALTLVLRLPSGEYLHVLASTDAAPFVGRLSQRSARELLLERYREPPGGDGQGGAALERRRFG